MTKINAAGIALVKASEGLRLHAYQDVGGVWTIGYGHTPASPGQTITDAEATALLEADLETAENAIAAATQDIPTTEDQFSAMVSLAFNIGNGAFEHSTVLRKHRAGDHQGAADAFLMWDKAHVDGALVTLPALYRRRGEERALYMSQAGEVELPAQPAPQGIPAPAVPQPVTPPNTKLTGSHGTALGAGITAMLATVMIWATSWPLHAMDASTAMAASGLVISLLGLAANQLGVKISIKGNSP